MYNAVGAQSQTVPLHIQALIRQNHSDFRQALYYMALDASSTAGALGVGVGTLFRRALIGGYSPALRHAALHTLTIAFFPLVGPGAFATADRLFRTLHTWRKVHRTHQHLAQSPDARASRIDDLYRLRQRELRHYYLADGTARATLTCGSAISVFVGPAGLLILVPGTLGVVAAEAAARRIVRVSDTVSDEERLQLRDDNAVFAAILKAHTNYRCLRSLRNKRRNVYPPGWGTYARPLLRLKYRKARRHDDPSLKYGVLALFAAASLKAAQPFGWVSPAELTPLLMEGRALPAFAKEVLKDTSLRRTLPANVLSHRRRHWTLHYDALAHYMEYHSDIDPGVRGNVERLYAHAEEALLTAGKTESHRRQRALLDLYGRLVRTRAPHGLQRIIAPVRRLLQPAG